MNAQNYIVAPLIALALAGCQVSGDLGTTTPDENPVEVEPKSNVPVAPAYIAANWLADSLLLSWEDLSDNENYFEIAYRLPAGDWQNSFYVDANETTIELANLPDEPVLVFRVRSGNSYGESDWVVKHVTDSGDISENDDNSEGNVGDNSGNNDDDAKNTDTTKSALTSPNSTYIVKEDTLQVSFTSRDRLWLDAGTSLGGNDLFNAEVSGTSAVISGLPEIDGTLFLRLWTYLNGGWEYNDYSFQLKRAEDSNIGDSSDNSTDTGTGTDTGNATRPEFSSTPGQVAYQSLNFSGNAGVQLYTGRNNGEGVDLVVLSEGYTASELSKFVTDAKSFIDEAFDFHPIDKHMTGWNIHILSLPSNQSGADHATGQGNLVDTRFGANYFCSNIERLLCINSSSVFSEVAQYVPQYDEILVLVNSTKYGGAGYSSGIATASLASSVVNLIRHEIAHSFAGLADEYTYGKSAPPSTEPRAANVTIESNPNNLKWKHWIENPSSVVLNQGDGVGLWEGASYVSTGAYRPLKNSLMKSLGVPFGEVNSEQWAASVYEYIDPVLSTVPSESTLQMTRNEQKWFAIESLYRAENVKTTWRVNNQVVSTAENDEFYYAFKPTSSGTYNISVDVVDDTGVIRKNLETRTGQTIRWTVQVN